MASLSTAAPTAAALTAGEFAALRRFVFATLPQVDAITLGRQHRITASRKADGTEVTAADKAAERLLRARVRKVFPTDEILGEEYGGEIARQGRTWLIDPIDGTASYVLGLGTFGTLIALLIDGIPAFGCIHLPAMRETTFAATGHGCWLQRAAAGRPQRVRAAPARPFADAIIGLTTPKSRKVARYPAYEQVKDLVKNAGGVRLAGDCVQYALVCRGALDAAVDLKMSAWDIAALVVCVEEAGGAVGDLAGRTTDLLASKSLIAASSDALRRSITRRLKRI